MCQARDRRGRNQRKAAPTGGESVGRLACPPAIAHIPSVRAWLALMEEPASGHRHRSTGTEQDEADDSRGHAGHRPAGRHSHPGEGEWWSGYRIWPELQLELRAL